MKLSFKTKLFYGLGGVADNAMYTMAGTFLLFFLTGVAGIKPAAAGTIVALGSVWEAICGPIVGFLSDNTETRFGRRKPFLMIASFPVAIVMGLLFITIDASYGLKLVYYTAMTLLFWQSFATFFVPYLAWGADLTEDYNERTVLRSYAYVFNQFGMALGMVMPSILVDFIMSAGRSKETAWTLVGVGIGILCGAALFISAFNIKDSDIKGFKRNPNRPKIISIKNIADMFRDYGSIIRLRPIQYIMSASVLYLIANAIFSSGRIYYFTYNLGLKAWQVSAIMFVITVIGIVIAPLVAMICAKTDKKDVLCIGVGMTGILMVVSRFAGVETFLACCMISTIYSIGNTCYWQLMPSIIYDVCEAEELASGEQHSGQVISLQALSESLAVAIGSQILGAILQLAGFVDGMGNQTETALTWISNSFTLIPGMFMLVCALVLRKHPINKHSFKRIMNALEIKRNGGEVSMDDFVDIYGKSKI